MIKVQEASFDPGEVINEVTKASEGGAVVSFLGQVRAEDCAGTDAVTGLYLEHHPTMTVASIQKIVDEARERWETEQIRVIHRVGTLKPGEPIVLVCVSAAHRRAAFETADFLMDYLKSRALFWKKEMRVSGSEWVEPRAEDYQDADRWARQKQGDN
ncbi:MAG: molybdenum cofactor biosynthesis protein MoaE [Hyphococcus sp.]|nr:MAG: molybdenum cofactor biosynthesis protein MoaE [Marinicaulis sp.]